MPLMDKLKEVSAKYIAETLLMIALTTLGAIAIFADQMLPQSAFEALGSLATGRIMLGLCLVVLMLIAWVIYLHPRLVFDKRVGAFFHPKTGLYYCQRCRITKRLNSPMLEREEHRGWTCPSCGLRYDNPDFKEPPPPPSRGGRNSWMRI